MWQAGIPFIDAHVHLWDLARLRYPWLTPPFGDDGPNGSVAAIARDYRLDDYLAEAGRWQVRGIVHVDAGAHPDDALGETEWLQSLGDSRGLPSGIVAFAALDDPDVERLLAAHACHDRVRGIRHIVNWHADAARTYTPRDVTGDPEWARGFALLAKYELSFDLQAYAGQFAGLARLFAAHSETPVIINHMGMAVDRDAEGLAAWRTGMRALAALPQVSVKISGMGFVDRDWTRDTGCTAMRDYVLETIDIFGPARAMIASDFPTDRLFGSFDATLDAYSGFVADFTPAERHALFAGTANRVYRLGIDL